MEPNFFRRLLERLAGKVEVRGNHPGPANDAGSNPGPTNSTVAASATGGREGTGRRSTKLRAALKNERPEVISTPIHKMTIEQLQSLIRFHTSMAETFESHSELGTARGFRELAQKYRTELDTRPPDPPVARKEITYRGAE